MSIEVYNAMLNIVKEALKISIGPISVEIGEESKNINGNGNISLDEIRKQIILAQELAIAKRIETADEVEIEEYYDNSVSGNMDGKVSTSGVGIGVGANGSIISKKVYKFKGYNDKRIEAYEQTRDKVLKIDLVEENK
ncbi:MAG: hypothetical protein E6923_17495 [Clostridium sp.]|uniref:hypothetical protein n=1 Tax=Clostridium sp. TaxID=1506 RepID=UPI00290104F5|nr:hypothetical protein [Clostridium sp.]MDU1312431.1 hypothetical protein [Clostridium sp.]MDU1409636.1 hypothetical protein [Clostridium sp.]